MPRSRRERVRRRPGSGPLENMTIYMPSRDKGKIQRNPSLFDAAVGDSTDSTNSWLKKRPDPVSPTTVTSEVTTEAPRFLAAESFRHVDPSRIGRRDRSRSRSRRSRDKTRSRSRGKSQRQSTSYNDAEDWSTRKHAVSEDPEEPLESRPTHDTGCLSPESPERLRDFVRKGFWLGKHLSECAVFTSDIYQQECTTQHKHRGDNSLFFTHDNNEGNEDDDSAGSIIYDDSVRRKPKRQYRSTSRLQSKDMVISSDDDDDILLKPPKLVNSAREPRTLGQDPDSRENDAPYQSKKGIRFPQAREITTVDQEELKSSLRDVLNTPREACDPEGERGFQSDESRMDEYSGSKPRLSTDLSDLRNIRLKERVDEDATSTAVKYSRALEDLAMQDSSMKTVQKDLQSTREALEQATKELDETRVSCARQLQATHETSNRIFLERVDVEERLRQQISLNSELQRRLSKMEMEASRVSRNLDFGNVAGNEEMSTHLEMLRTESVSLKAQVTKACESRNEALKNKERVRSELKDATREVQLLNEEINELKEEVAGLQQKLGKAKSTEKATKDLQREVARMRLQVTNSNAALANHRDANVALTTKLKETQVEASALRTQVSETLGQLQVSTETTRKKELVSEAEAQSLQKEIRRMKSSLDKANAERVDQASRHLVEKRELEEELATARRLVEAAQTSLSISDVPNVAQNSETTSPGIFSLPEDMMSLLRRATSNSNDL